MHKHAYTELLVALKVEEFNPEDIADLIKWLFEFTGNDSYKLWQVTEELYKISMTPLEHENPVFIDDDLGIDSQELT